MRSSREYWMTYDAKDLVSELQPMRLRYLQSSFNPIYQMWLRNTYSYYSTVLESQSWLTSLNFVGEQGELVKMSIPQSRALIRQLLTLITKEKLAFYPVARASDSDVTEVLRICKSITEDVVAHHDLDIKRAKLAERGFIQGTGFIKTVWRSDLGAPKLSTTLEDGTKSILYEGDVEISLPTVWDVLFDWSKESWEETPWCEVRVKRNRWALIAQHPDLEEQILKLPSCNDGETRSPMSLDKQDDVYVYEMYHRPMPGLDRGRMTFYSDERTIYFDDFNKYETLPVERYAPEPIEGLGFGYAMLSNILPAQEMLDNAYSMLATNMSSLGTVNIANPRGSDVSVQQINGLNFVDYTPQNIPGGGLPSKLDLLQSAPELFKFPDVLLSSMQQLSFVNAAVRGELPASTSGIAIATLTGNALEFLEPYSRSIKACMEKTMMHVINAYAKFASSERIISIVGQNQQSYPKTFSGEMLGSIEKISMQTVNPLMQTLAGRLDIADKAIQQGLVKDMQSYVSVLDGQPLSVLFKPEQSENDLIQSENESMLEGQQVPVLATDKHPLHIFQHKVLINDPKVRANAGFASLVLEHIMEHVRLAQETSPALQAMAATGVQPSPEMFGPPPAPPQASGAEGPVSEVMTPGETIETGEGSLQGAVAEQSAVNQGERAKDLIRG